MKNILGAIINSGSGKIKYPSKNVKFNFDLNKINPYIRRNLISKQQLKG